MFYPSMSLLVREKSNYWRQIPFVAVSSWVYVQAGNSHINWLVTPANFSLAVPGVSSGGGESFDPEASSAAGSQPCDIWITTTSAAVSLPDISSNTSNLSISLNRASQLLVKGMDGNIYTCVFTSMGKRFTYPAHSTLIGGELHVYHCASTPGSVKLSFKASSAEEEHDVVRVSFFQISGPVNQSE